MTKESRKAAVDDQYGGESDAGKARHQFSSLFKSQNAYMLVYIRETEWDEIMCQVVEEDVALHLRERVRVRALTFGWMPAHLPEHNEAWMQHSTVLHQLNVCVMCFMYADAAVQMLPSSRAS